MTRTITQGSLFALMLALGCGGDGESPDEDSSEASTDGSTTTTIDAANTQNPTQPSSLRAAYMWLRLTRRPVMNTSATWTTMNTRK